VKGSNWVVLVGAGVIAFVAVSAAHDAQGGGWIHLALGIGVWQP
jgi:glycerol uptake facilitator-like aquaporin